MYVLNPLKTENVPESKLFQKGSKQVYLMTVCAFYEKGQRPNISVLLILVFANLSLTLEKSPLILRNW